MNGINTAGNRRRLLKQPSDMAPTPVLREILTQGISSGNFIDTKVILYSHRDPSGRVGRPKALYANSHVLKTVPYFSDREHAVTHGVTHPEPHCATLLSAVWRFRGVPTERLQ